MRKRAIAGLAIAAGTLLPGCAGEPRWNVLLLTLDTTRADFIGCYGSQRASTPTLDGLAAEGFLFEQATASNPVTQAAHATILTGVYPMLHGVRDNLLFRLPEQRETLAELLRAAGWRTGAAIGGFPLTREFGTAQGFDFYDDDLRAERLDHRGRPAARQRPTWYDERPAAHVNDAIRPWLREESRSPFFAWLHYWDPHEPHIPPAPWSELFADDLYSGEIAYADRSLGALLDELRATGEYERTLIVVTGDHGEGRLEHEEMTHAFLAYEATLHVPLIVRVPGMTGGRRIAERVATVDILPTVLDLLGLEAPAELQGRSLAPLLRDQPGASDPRRVHYAESLSPRLSHGFGELRALYRGPLKYVHGPRPELFDLESDPHELADLAAQRPEALDEMQAALRRFVAAHASPASVEAAYEASDETRERLAALGYIGAGVDGSATVSEELRTDGIAPQDRVGDVNRVQRLRQQLGSRQFGPARQTAEELLRLSPGHDFYEAKLAAACVGLGALDDARAVVEAAESVSAANLADFLGVAEALYESGEHEAGLALARRLLAEGPTVDGLVTLARLELESKDVVASGRTVARALELDEEHPGARLEHARWRRASGRVAEAERELHALLADHPAHPEAWLLHARLLQETGRAGEALGRLDRLLVLRPGACEAHLQRLELYLSSGRPDDARQGLRSMRRTCLDRDALQRAASLLEAE